MKLKVILSGKEISLRFGMLCWEGVISLSDKGTSPTKAMANLIFSAMQNEDEVTGKDQKLSYVEVLELVDTAMTLEDESKQLAEAEKIFQESTMYKNFLKSMESKEDKKKQSRSNTEPKAALYR